MHYYLKKKLFYESGVRCTTKLNKKSRGSVNSVIMCMHGIEINPINFMIECPVYRMLNLNNDIVSRDDIVFRDEIGGLMYDPISS